MGFVLRLYNWKFEVQSSQVSKPHILNADFHSDPVTKITLMRAA